MPISQINTNAIANNIVFSGTGGVGIPSGNTAQRPTGNTPYIRYNTDLSSFEGQQSGQWKSVGGGAVGGGTDKLFYTNDRTMTTSYTLASNTNAMITGPFAVDIGAVLTISANSRLVIL